MDRRWHYAVWKNFSHHMWPACMSPGVFDYGPDGYLGWHGQTINRGDVNCPHCLQMMGVS